MNSLVCSHYLVKENAERLHLAETWRDTKTTRGGPMLYHYTSLENALSILNHRTINLSDARIPEFGIYMTRLYPMQPYHLLLDNNYNGNP